ncbi:ComEC/Rec2 family competence protein [Intrasporangium mesophilum]
MRPKVERRLDLRLLLPVLVAWPVLGFWGLLAPIPLVGAAGLCALAAASAILLTARRGGRAGRPGGRPSHGAGAEPQARRLVARLSAVGSWLRPAAAVLAVVALLLVAGVGHRLLRSVGPVEALAEQRAVVTIAARVAGQPRPVAQGAGSARRATSAVVLEVEQVQGRGERMSVQTPVLVVASGGQWAALRWDEHVAAVVRLEPAQPGDDVVAVARPKGAMRVTSAPGAVYAAAEHVRSRFLAATGDVWSDARGLVPALVVGDTTRTPPDLTEAMQATGLSHLSAVSGSNVTLVLAAAVGLCGLAGIRRRWRAFVSVVVLAAFVVLARPEPSVVRAAVMGAVGLAGLSMSRRRAGVPALAGAVTVLLVWDPWLSRSYGFALSSVATLGLLVFARPWGLTLARWLPRRLGWLGPVVAVPVAAQVVCAPIVAPLQGSVSLVAIVANLLAAPFVAPATVLGVAVAALSVVSITAAGWLAWAAAAPAQAIAAVARWCAQTPGGVIAWGDSAGAAVALALVTTAVIALAPWAWHRSRHRPTVATAVVLLTVGFLAPTAALAWPPPGWVLIACDVGQGDALVVDLGQGHVIVVDTGPEPRLIRGCLDRVGATSVDLVVLTHYHADHAEGFAGVLDRPVGEVLASPVRDPPAEALHVARLAAQAQVRVSDLRAGQSISVRGVTADVWWPARRIDAGSVPNNASIVLTMHVRGVTLLLAGDIEREAAAEVLHEAALEPARWGHVDVLKVPHHGSSNRDDRLLDRVEGRLAVISVGKDNDYGHPAPSTLHALESRGFEVHRTDLEGDVAVVEDASGIRAVSR